MDTQVLPSRPVDAEVVKSEVVAYMGNIIEQAQQTALAVQDDASADQAVSLGSMIKAKLVWLKAKRKEVYDPLYQATERVRQEFDDPIKLGTQLEKTLSAAVVDFRLKKRREEEKARLAAEAEARRIREEAERKAREAEAERQRIIRERELEEQRKRDAAEAEARRQREAEEAKAREIQLQAQREQDERARRLREEEDARLAKAQEAKDVGLEDRVEKILERQTPIAPIVAPLKTADQLAAEAEAKRKEAEEQERQRLAQEEARKAEEAKRAEEAERVRKMQEEADKAKAEAAAAEAAAAARVSVTRPDDRMRTSVTWKYEVPDQNSFLKLVKAVAEGRAPVEYLGFDPDHPEKFRASAIGKDVLKLKADFGGEAIGIRVWPEEGGSFKAAKGA